MMLINKILPPSVNRSLLLKNLNNVHISYRHNESKFIVNFGNKFESADTKINSNNTEEILFHVERKSFIQSVIGSFISKEIVQPAKSKNVVIDFSSPNIAKPFHAGHLRSTVIGNFMANIHTHFGDKVVKINYLGDWGTQFGLLQYGLKAKNVNIDSLKINALKSLYDVYVYANKLATTDENVMHEARKYFSDVEQGRASLENWKKIRIITVEELEKVYKRLGIKFNAYIWESDYNGKVIQPLMESLINQNIIWKDETGKMITRIKDRDITLLKSDNSTMYLSREIASLLHRHKTYQFDKMLYVVDNSQTAHFQELFHIVKKINQECEEGCEHIKFGRVRGMSTRAGNVVFLNDILDEAKRKMHEKQAQSKNTRKTAMTEDTCDVLGISAVIINDLKQKRQKDYVFDWERALQSEGDSGIKLQYLHCRLWNLEQNCGVSLPKECDPDHLDEELICNVIAEMAKFESVLQRSLAEYEACILVNYLFRFAKHVNRMFNEIKVKDVSNDLAMQRLLVFYCARQIVKTGLEILEIGRAHV